MQTKAKEAMKKLQGLSESTRKIILWSITILVAILLLVWWVSGVKNSFQNSDNPNIGEQLQLEKLEEEFQNNPIIN